MSEWISTLELSELADISDRKTRAALENALQGKPWRDSHLQVRELPGRGGKSGKAYKVLVSSLPKDLQEEFRRRNEAMPAFVKAGREAQAEREFWYDLIAPALEFDFNTKERAEAIQEIASKIHINPDGTKRTITARHVRNKIKAFELGGMTALGKKPRASRGVRRVNVSFRWQKAVEGKLDDVVQNEIHEKLISYIRAQHKAGIMRSDIQLRSGLKVRKWSEEHGVYLPDEVCKIPEDRVKQEKNYRAVKEYHDNRKAYEDKRPRIDRNRIGMLPMDVVFGDVHPMDFVVLREDGSTTYPKAICWLDAATNRIWMDIVILDKGKGITNAHVIASFVQMVTKWGVPRYLYVDNGSEYNWTEFIADALELLNRGHQFQIEYGSRSTHVINALPYNASAKPIEAIFAILEALWSHLPGHIGGDRMKQKTQNLGKAPMPYPNGVDHFRSAINAILELYHNKAQRGTLKNRSPYEVYQNDIQAGWTMATVEPDTFAIVFSEKIDRVVHQGQIQYDGRMWYCDELARYLEHKVTVLVPKYHGWNRLPLMDKRGEIFGFAEPDCTYGMLDPAGAKESFRRATLHKTAVKQLDRSAPTLNVIQDLAETVAMLPPSPIAPEEERISATREAKTIHQGIFESDEARRDRKERDIEKTVAKELEIARKFQKIRGAI